MPRNEFRDIVLSVSRGRFVSRSLTVPRFGSIEGRNERPIARSTAYGDGGGLRCEYDRDGAIDRSFLYDVYTNGRHAVLTPSGGRSFVRLVEAATADRLIAG
jgi:hypothetical protein